MKKLLLIITIMLLPFILVIPLALYYGLLAPLTVDEMIVGPFTIISRPFSLNYDDTQTELHKLRTELTRDYAILSTSSFGLYNERPTTPRTSTRDTKKATLSGSLGIIVPSLDPKLIAMLSPSFTVKTLHKFPAFVTTFPLKNERSPIIAAYRVYYSLDAFLVRKGYKTSQPVMEIYDVSQNKIIYIIAQ